MRILLAASLLVLANCVQGPTEFVGKPMFPGGPQGCATHCAQQGLTMTTFVYSGEFATSCVCGVSGAPTSSSAIDVGSGVVTQMRAAEAARLAAARKQSAIVKP